MIRSSTNSVVRLLALAGDQLSEQREREVRVVVLLRRAEHELDPGHRVDQLLGRRRLTGDEHLPRLALQSGEVAEQAPDRRRAVRDPVEMLLEPVVEVELPFGAELHDRRRGERLRDRADAVLRVRLRLGAVLVVRRADRVRPDDLAVAHDRCRDARQPVGLPLGEQAVERLKPGHELPAPRGTSSSARSMSSSVRSRCVTARRTPGRIVRDRPTPRSLSRSTASHSPSPSACTSICTKFDCTRSSSIGTPCAAHASASLRARAWSSASRSTLWSSAKSPAAATIPAWRIAPPKRCFSRRAASISVGASRRSARRAGSRGPSRGTG